MLYVIVFCDIDGTIIPSYFDQVKKYNKQKLYDIQQKVKNITLSKRIISTLHTITKNSDLIFLTGRPKKWEELTYNMLEPLKYKKFKIYFHNCEGEWSLEKYFKFKLNIINDVSQDYGIVFVIDDNIDLLKYIKKHFKWANKSLLLINGEYCKTINDMVINHKLI